MMTFLLVSRCLTCIVRLVVFGALERRYSDLVSIRTIVLPMAAIALWVNRAIRCRMVVLLASIVLGVAWGMS